MKKITKLTAMLILAILTVSASTALAQRGQGKMDRGMRNPRMPVHERMYEMIPDLTEEQENQLQDLRVEHMKEMTDFRNQLDEKQARLRTLETKDDPEMKAINGMIEEMGQIRIEMHKARAEHRQEVRQILNEEQRAFYDARMYRHHNRRPGMHGPRRGGRGLNRSMDPR